MKKEKVIPIALGAVVIVISAFLGCKVGLENSDKKFDVNNEVTKVNNKKEEIKDSNTDEKKEEVPNITSDESLEKENKEAVLATPKKTDGVKKAISAPSAIPEGGEVSNTKDDQAIVAFSQMENSVDNLLAQDDNESFKDQAKGVFIDIVDFVFYGSEINGITFGELTESGKQKVLNIASNIDKKIENKIPGYKETISTNASSALNKASELIKKGASNISDFAKEQLGDKYYQDIVNAKDEFVKYSKNALSTISEVGGSLLDKGKDKVSNWYQKFKNK